MLLERANSFIAVWRVPRMIVPNVIEAFSRLPVHSDFFQDKQILELMFDEKTLYQRNARLKSMYRTSIDKSVTENLSAATHVRIIQA